MNGLRKITTLKICRKLTFQVAQVCKQISCPTYYTIPRTSIETRDTQENTSTQADTNELSAPEKKKRERWSESQTKFICGRNIFVTYKLQNYIRFRSKLTLL